MKKTNSIISIIMIFLIITTSIAPIFADKFEPETVHILTEEDLIQFSQDCSLDVWSQGKTVYLDADLDLDNMDFIPIPTFGGIFDGQGHKISGLSVKVEGSNQGLFRYLQEDGIIKDLTVEGVIIPTGEKSTIGGIVGHSNGILENCNFSGFVKGKDTVGGLVGWTCSTAMIINSNFDGVVYGEGKVGGIVGHNGGTVLRCSNDSKVNTTVEEQKLGLSDITLDNINFSSLVPDATDIGGIAGFNTGIIQSSENYGKVGYPHVGYNVGGITGRQSGYVTKCINYGTVYGRKEVAGVVGQMEPYISTIIGSSKLSQLQKELNSLDRSIGKVINDTKTLNDVTTENLLSVQDDIDGSLIHAQSLIDQTESMLNLDIDQINELSVIGVEALDMLIPITESVEKLIDTMSEAIDPLAKAIEYMVKLIKESEYMLNKFSGSLESLEDTLARINNAKEKLKRAYNNILRAKDLLRKGEFKGVYDLLKSAYKDISDVNKSLVKAIKNIDIQPILDELENTLDDTELTVSYMKYAIDYMLEAVGILEYVTGDIGEVISGFTNLIEFLTDGVDIKFATTDDEYEKIKEDLWGSVGDVSKSLTKFIEDLSSEGNKLISDMEGLNNQLFKVMNLMINIIEELASGEVSQDDIIKDVSSEDIESKTEGKVSDCKNLGIIEGDLNVGGIAGGMSIELFDPEKDLNLQGKLSYNTVFESRASIFRCENTGDIISKKNEVGGIVGSMDLGYIKDCIVSSFVESIDGDYVGGIAGKSDGPIVSSYVRGSLNGGNYIGGISGLGTEIIDSFSLVKIDRSRACVGAIAGNVDNRKNIKTNYFVSDVLQGIDGISYKDRAEAITYESLISIEGLSNIFRKFKLSFWADDKILDTMDFNYGDSIYEKDFPEIPVKESYYGIWEEFDTKSLTFDKDIHAVYIPYMTILDSKIKRNDTLPIVLVEGKFINGDSIDLVEDEKPGPLLEKDDVQLEQWTIDIPQDGEDKHIVRYLPPENKKNLKAFILKDDSWIDSKANWDGKYLVFETSGNIVTFSIVDSGVTYIKYLILIGGAVLIILILIIIIRRLKKRKTKRPVDE